MSETVTPQMKAAATKAANKLKAEKAKGMTLVKVSRRRDGDMSDIYSCVKGTDGETISMKVPLDVEVQLDNNIIKSLKTRTEMVRVSVKGKPEQLTAKPTYFIEVI